MKVPKEQIPARNIQVNMVVSMHGKPQRVTDVRWKGEGRLRIDSENDTMVCNRSTTLTRYL